MKLRFVVTPQRCALATELAADASTLEQAGFAGIAETSPTSLEVELAADELIAGDRAVAELTGSCAGWERMGVRLQCERAPGNAGGGGAAPAGWSFATGSDRFNDVDGARTHDALPRVLARLARDAAARGGEAPTLVRLPAGSARPLLAVAKARAGRFVELDPARGAQIALVERLRALACAGAAPLAANATLTLPPMLAPGDVAPLSAMLRALAEAGEELGVTLFGSPLAVGASPASSPQMHVAALGAVAEERHVTAAVVQQPGHSLVLLGETPHELGGSLYAEVMHGVRPGPAPAVELAAEKRLNKTLLALIKAGVIAAARPLAAGGLLATAAEMLCRAQQPFGAKIDVTPLGGGRADALLFGESQGRVVVAVAAGRVGTVLTEAQIRGVPAVLIGEVTDGAAFSLKTRSLATEWDVAELRAAASTAAPSA